MNQKTLQFYNQNSDAYVLETAFVNFQTVQDKFLEYVPTGSFILDVGCGSGRDSKYFLDKGYKVEAIDGSIELCKRASEFTGIQVQYKMFHEIDAMNRYDAVWASASLLHCPSIDLPNIFYRVFLYKT